MSKTDDMRAMREARYKASAAAAAKPTAAPVTPRRTPVKVERAETAAEATPEAAPAAEGQPGLCGHRAISGRTCTREAGHTVKSHRYS